MSKILFRDKAAQTSNKKCFSSQKRLHKKKNEKTGKIIMPKSNIPMRICTANHAPPVSSAARSQNYARTSRTLKQALTLSSFLSFALFVSSYRTLFFRDPVTPRPAHTRAHTFTGQRVYSPSFQLFLARFPLPHCASTYHFVFYK